MKIALAPTLEKFVSGKIKTGTYLDTSDVIRESLRRWREQEEAAPAAPDWLEQEVQEGLDSPDLQGGTGFWRDLRKELHTDTGVPHNRISKAKQQRIMCLCGTDPYFVTPTSVPDQSQRD